MNRRHALMTLGSLFGMSLGLPGCSRQVTRLDGAGSSFVDPIMQEWAFLYHQKTQTNVNYQSRGSGAGIDMMVNRLVDYGCTDAPMTKDQLAQAKERDGEVIHIPVCTGALVAAYNLPGIANLVLSGPVLAEIFLGKITTWNDSAIQALNPGVTLPAERIGLVWRSDTSGSTAIWTEYLGKVHPEFKTKIKASTSATFPVGVGQKGSDGIAGFVKRSVGALGYVEMAYALDNQISFAAIVNRENQAVKVGKHQLSGVTAAAASAEIPDNLCYSLTNAPGKETYPVAATTWAVFYVRQPSPAKARQLHEFLHWITHEGQTLMEELDYAPLPTAIVQRIDGKLARLLG